MSIFNPWVAAWDGGNLGLGPMRWLGFLVRKKCLMRLPISVSEATIRPRLGVRRFGAMTVVLAMLIAGMTVQAIPSGAAAVPAAHPRVDLHDNQEPSVPTEQTIDSCYLACTSPATVSSGTPVISARVFDPDGGTLLVEYEVFDDARTTMMATSGTAMTGVSSGSARGWRIAPTPAGTLSDGTYHWRVRACDSYVCGAYSGWFTFTVNTQPVSPPTVSGDPYLESSTGTWNGGPGIPGTFTFGPGGTGDVAEYVYSLNGGNTVTVPAGIPQTELLSANQQSVSTDLTGFKANRNVNLSHSSLGHDSAGSVQVTPSDNGTNAGAEGDTFARIGGSRLGMAPGKRYHITGWIWVPSATGLDTTGKFGGPRGLRIVAVSKSGSGDTALSLSRKATITDRWQQLSVVLSVPSDASNVHIRLYNGAPIGSGKSVYWDDLSVRELTGTSTVETITPTQDGTNILSVQSRNMVGTYSEPRVYLFLVTPATAAWNWTFDQNTGTTTASDPNTHPASLSETGVTWTSPGRVGAGAMSFTDAGQLTTSSPVLDTSAPAGFTVAAWVRLSDLSGSRTAVSQDGVNTSAFRLGFRDDRDVDGDGANDPAWCFSVASTDVAGSSASAACTTELVATDQWVALVGVYDKPSNKIGLYLSPGGDPLLVEADIAGGWQSTGAFAIGRALDDAAPSDRWIGDIDHVHAAAYVWSETDVFQFTLQ